MHSPPVQPISSSRSGTGSVSTMWLEVTVRRPRTGEPAAPLADPRASTHAPERIRAAGVSARQPQTARAQTADGRVLEHPDAGTFGEPVAQPEREPRRLHGGGSRIESSRTEARRAAALGDLLGAQLLDRVLLVELAAGGDRLVPDAVLCGGGRQLQVAPAPVPGVHPLLLAEGTDLVDSVLGRLCDEACRRTADALPQGVQAEPHGIDEAAVPAAWPVPAAIRLQHDHLGFRLELRDLPGGPHARVATADHEDVAAQLSLGRRQRRALTRLLQPVSVRRVVHRPPIKQGRGPMSLRVAASQPGIARTRRNSDA